MTYSSGTNPTDYTFTGQFSYTDDFGLMFYNARWYDPSLGRFAQADTIVPKGVQGLDRYAYVNNNPLRYTDPSGHLSEDEIMELFGVKKWKEVIKLFEKDGKYEGKWGWLELLRFAESGNILFSANSEMDGARVNRIKTDFGELVLIDGQYFVQTESGLVEIGTLIESTNSELIGLSSSSGSEGGLYLFTEHKYSKVRVKDWNNIDKIDLGVDIFGVIGDASLLVPGIGGVVWGTSEAVEVLTVSKAWDDLDMGNPNGVLTDIGSSIVESSKLVYGAGFIGNLVSIGTNVLEFKP